MYNVLPELEKERLKIRNLKIVKKVFIFLFVFSVLAIFVFSKILSPQYAKYFFALPFVFIILAVVFGSITSNLIKSFREKYKTNIVKPILSSYLPDCEYTPEGGIDSGYIARLGVFPISDIYNTEDLITGYHNGVKFERSDISIKDKSRDSDGDTKITTIFKGQWFVLSFDKKIGDNVQVYDKKMRSVNFGRIPDDVDIDRYIGGQGLNIFKIKEIIDDVREMRDSFQNVKKIKVSDSSFNDKFYISAYSEEEAYSVLTPQTINLIKNLSNDINDEIMLYFDYNKLNIIISSYRSSLEPSYSKNCQESLQKNIDNTKREIGLICNFIDQF